MYTLDRKEKAALDWLRVRGSASEFHKGTPRIEVFERLCERGMVCARLLEPHPRLTNVARARYRVTWLGRAAQKLAL